MGHTRLDHYSPLKVFHHRDRIDAMRRGERPQLIHAQLILTNLCQHSCNFCAYRSHGYSSSEDFRDRDEIPVEKAAEIVESCRALGVKAIEITGGGEPLIYRGLPRVCDDITAAGMGYGIVTNGSAVTDKSLRALLRARWVRVSMDAGRPETYAAIRRVSRKTFDRTRRNLYTLVQARQGPDPVVGVGFVVTRENWRE
ncbi:MAG: radical SAM protein, partial [Gammaproteobacteria bacterium]|nr:radical SAM protein [Gammaproteobacteria bacterium]